MAQDLGGDNKKWLVSLLPWVNVGDRVGKSSFPYYYLLMWKDLPQMGVLMMSWIMIEEESHVEFVRNIFHSLFIKKLYILEMFLTFLEKL